MISRHVQVSVISIYSYYDAKVTSSTSRQTLNHSIYYIILAPLYACMLNFTVFVSEFGFINAFPLKDASCSSLPVSGNLFLFCYLILRGDPLSQRLLFRGPTELLQYATHTVRHNTITSNHKQSYTHTHTVWSVAAHFFQVVQGCRAGFEPRISHSSRSASSLTATEPPLHPN